MFQFVPRMKSMNLFDKNLKVIFFYYTMRFNSFIIKKPFFFGVKITLFELVSGYVSVKKFLG